MHACVIVCDSFDGFIMSLMLRVVLIDHKRKSLGERYNNVEMRFSDSISGVCLNGYKCLRKVIYLVLICGRFLGRLGNFSRNLKNN